MPVLTLDLIRDNPWSAVTHTLPVVPDRLLLETAHFAVAYCRDSEFRLMTAARDGSYVPTGWTGDGDQPDVHEESEARMLTADGKIREICDAYEKAFGDVLER